MGKYLLCGADGQIGEISLQQPRSPYFYKGLVGIPPLQMVDDILAIQKYSMESMKVNKAINTFIELEKLTLSKSKCHNIHIGNKKSICPSLKVHDSKMENSKQETYLGDILDESGNNKANLRDMGLLARSLQ